MTPITRSLFLSTASGVMIGLSWNPSIRPWFLLVSCVPLWLEWFQNPRTGRVFAMGWLASFIGTLIACPWVAHTARMYFSLSWIVGIFWLIVFSAIAYLQIPIAGLIWVTLKNVFKLEIKRSMVLLPFLLVVLEALYPSLLPVNYGYPWMWSGLSIVQITDWVGFSGLSLFTYLMNLLIIICILRFSNKYYLRAATGAGLGVIAFCAINGLAYWHGKSWIETDRVRKIALIQPNHIDRVRAQAWIGPGDQYVTYFYHNLARLTQHQMLTSSKSNLILWPEVAMPIWLDQRSAHTEKIKEIVDELGVPLLLGGYSTDEKAHKFNAIAVIEPSAGLTGFYRKSSLMPFGEYLPGSGQFPFLKKIMPVQFEPAEDVGLRIIGGTRYGLTICYEELLSELVSQLVNEGAQILLNFSNDYWFGEAIAPYITHYIAAARAIEARRPLVRITNTGVSSVMLASGRFLTESPVFAEWTATVNVPYRESASRTLFSRFGFIWPWAIGVMIIMIVAFEKFIHQQRKPTE